MPSRTGKKRRSFSVLLTMGLVGFACYFVISWVGLQGTIKESREELASVSEACEVQEYENRELKRILEDDNESELIERIARKELGYVMPGERVYFDVSSSN